MAYTPKTQSYNQPAQQQAAPAKQEYSSKRPDGTDKVKIAGSIIVTASGAEKGDKGERICNLFLNEKNGKKWLSGKDKDGNRFTIFLND